jgi:hypothetical protein
MLYMHCGSHLLHDAQPKHSRLFGKISKVFWRCLMAHAWTSLLCTGMLTFRALCPCFLLLHGRSAVFA